mgnify:CR=1 FL=1
MLNCARDALGRRHPPEVALEAGLAAWPGVEREELMDLPDALGRLGPPRREVVVLRFVGGFGPAEIAEILGAPEGTVHSRPARGLAELRLGLRGQGP